MSRPITRLAPAAFLLLTCIPILAVPPADALPKPAGPLGIWSSSDGLVYQAPDIPESTNVQTAFAFGDFWDLNDLSYEGLTFRQRIETTCNEWNVERFTGVIRPPSEGGVLNVPADYDLAAWAGNRTTDSTLYYAVAEQGGRVSAPVSVWIKRGGEKVFPDILLPGPAGVGHETASGPAARRLPQIDTSPDPFRETTVIRYSVTHTEHLRVRVLDIGGREIVPLADTWCSPGEHHTIWNGQDRSGEKAPAGMYFLRLEDRRGSPRASGRVLLLR